MPDIAPIFPDSTTVSITDLDISKYLPSNQLSTQSNPSGGQVIQKTLPGGPIDVSGYQPVAQSVANSDINKVSGYNSFQSNPQYNPSVTSLDNIRSYAANQGTGEWLYNNAAKFLDTTKNSFVGTFQQNIRNIQALTSWDASKLYDNQDNTQAQEALDYRLPTFGTGELDNSAKRFLPWNFGRSDFGGQMLPQLGFTVGTIGETLLENALITLGTGGLGEPAEAAKSIATLGGRLASGFSRLFESANAITHFKRGLQILESIRPELGLRSALKAGEFVQATNVAGNYAVKGLKLAANGYAMYNTAAGEAAFEANNIYNQHVRELTDDYEQKNGYKPFGKDLDAIKQSANKTAVATFGWNIPILLSSNLVQFGNILRPFKSEIAQTLEGAGLRLASKGLETTIEREAQQAITSKLGRVWGGTKKFGHFLGEAGSEGMEEFLQSVASTGSSAYYKSIYNGSKSGSALNDATNAVFDYAGSTASYDDFFGGFLGGAIFSGIGKATELSGLRDTKLGERYLGASEKTLDKRRADIVSQGVQALNETSTRDLQEYIFSPNIRNLTQQVDSSRKLADAILKGDNLGFDSAKSQTIAHGVRTAIETGTLNLFLSKLNIHNELDNEDIKQLGQLTDEGEIASAKTDVVKLTDAITQRAYQMQSDYNDINRKYQNRYDPKSAEYLAFEQAKWSRVLLKDRVNEDRKLSQDYRSQVSRATDGVIHNGIIDQATDSNLLKQQVEQLEAIEKETLVNDKTSPIYKQQMEQLSHLRTIQEERSKDNPNLDKIANSIYQMGLSSNPDNYSAPQAKESSISKLRDIVELEGRNAWNIGAYNYLNNRPINEEFRKHLQSMKDAAETLKEQSTPKPNTNAPVVPDPNDIPEPLEKTSQRLARIVNNPGVSIIQTNGKYRVVHKASEGSSQVTTKVSDDYDSLDDLFNDKDNFLKNIPASQDEIGDNIEKDRDAIREYNPTDKKKSEQTVFRSSSEPTWETRDENPEYLYRDQHLFNNLKSIKGKDIISIPLTPQNLQEVETKLGLQGQLQSILDRDPDYTFSAENPLGAISLLYAYQTPEGTYRLINQQGNDVTNLQDEVVTGKLVSLEDKAPAFFRDYFSPEEIQKLTELNNSIRKDLLAKPSFQPIPFQVSIGIENRQQDARTPVKKSITKTISHDSIHIDTKASVRETYPGSSEMTRPGRPYFITKESNPNGTTFTQYHYLDNTFLSDEQKDNILKALSNLDDDGKKNLSLTQLQGREDYTFLSGILQLTNRDVTSDRQAHITISPGGVRVQFRYNNTNQSIDIGAIQDPQSDFSKWLSNRYHNVNRDLLTNKKFTIPDGTQHTSYAHYLLDGNEPPLTTSFYNQDTHPDELPYVQRYAIYDFSHVTGQVESIAKPQQQAPPKSKPAITISNKEFSKDLTTYIRKFYGKLGFSPTEFDDFLEQVKDNTPIDGTPAIEYKFPEVGSLTDYLTTLATKSDSKFAVYKPELIKELQSSQQTPTNTTPSEEEQVKTFDAQDEVPDTPLVPFTRIKPKAKDYTNSQESQKVGQPPASNSTVGDAIAADYLLTGGLNSIQATDYFLRGLSGLFTRSSVAIDELRNQYAPRIAGSNLVSVKDFANSDLSREILSRISALLDISYRKEASVILNEVSKYPTGLPTKLGQQLSIRLDALHTGNELLKEQPQVPVSSGLPTTQDAINNSPLLKNATSNNQVVFIPRTIQEQAYQNDTANQGRQTIDRIIQRGGYSIEELDKLLPDWRSKVEALQNQTESKAVSSQNDNIPAGISEDDIFELMTERPQVIQSQPISQADLDWLKQILPQIGLNYNPTLERSWQDYQVFGSYLNKAINLYQGATAGTVYHEAFEAVFNGILTRKQQDALLKEFRKRQGEFTAWDGQTLNYSQATDHQAKEAIADEFIQWKQNQPKPTSGITGFFQKLWNYLKQFIQRFTSPIQRTYQDIDRGRYANDTVSDTTREYFQVGNLSAYQTQKNLNSFSALMFGDINAENISILSALDDGRYSEAQIYDSLYKKADRIFNFTPNDKIAMQEMVSKRYSFLRNQNAAISPDDLKTQVKDEFDGAQKRWRDEVSPNWNQFVQSHKNYISQFGAVFDIIERESRVESDRREGDDRTNEYFSDDKYLSSNVRDSISKSVKLILATLTDSIFLRSSVSGKEIHVEIPNETTLLPGTIIDHNKLFNRLLNHLSGYSSLDIFINKLEKLSQLTTEEEQYLSTNNRSVPLLVKAQFRELYDKVFTKLSADGKTRVRKDVKDIENPKELKLFLNFASSMAGKQAPQFLRSIVEPNSNAYFSNAVHDNAISYITRDARRSLFDQSYLKGKGFWIYRDNQQRKFVLNPANRLPLAQSQVSNQTERIDQERKNLEQGLGMIGFTVFDRPMLDSLTEKQYMDLKEQYNIIANLMQGNESFDNLDFGDGKEEDKGLGIGSRVRRIASIYAERTYDESDPMHLSADSQKQSNFLDTNFPASILADINSLQATTYQGLMDELLQKHPYYNDYPVMGSLLLRKFLNSKLNGEKLRMTILDGLQRSTGKGVKMDKVSEQELFITRFNANLDTANKPAVFSALENADGSINWGFQTGNYVDRSDIHSRGKVELLSAIKTNLLSELSFALSYKLNEFPERANNEMLSKTETFAGQSRKRGESLSFFSRLLPREIVQSIHAQIDSTTIPATREEILKLSNQIIPSVGNQTLLQGFLDFAQQEANNDKEYMSLNHFIEKGDNDRYDLYQVDEQYFSNGSKNLTEGELNDLLLERQVNYILHNMEMFKLFYGRPEFYKDVMKRTKSFQSPRLASFNSQELNNRLNSLLNDVKPNDLTYHEHTKDMTFYSVDDIPTRNETLGKYYPQYLNNASTDAQMFMQLSHVRELLWKAGGKWTEQQESELNLQDAYARLRLSDKKEDNGNPYYTYTENQRQRDEKLLEPYKSGNSYNLSAKGFVSIIKPIQTGFKSYNFQEPSILKTSVVPLTWSMVEGTKLEPIYLDMLRNKVGGFTFKSAHKVGQSLNQDKSLANIITPQGTLSPASNIATLESIPWDTFGQQVETQGTHSEGTLGTQNLKLLTGDIYDAGVPRDFSSDKGLLKRMQDWARLSKQEKQDQSPLYKLDQEHLSSLNDMFQVSYDDFMEDIGAIQTNGKYSIPNKEKLHDRLYKALESQGMPLHVLDQLKLNDDKTQFIVPLEMMQDYKTIKHMLYSMVDKGVLSPKMNGGAKIQMSFISSQLEGTDFKVRYRLKGSSNEEWKDIDDSYDPTKHQHVITNTSLKMYEPGENGKPTSRMQVMVSSRLKTDLNSYRKKHGLPTLTDSQLLSWLRSNQPRLLEGVGFRIPTQALSSIDAFEITGFLPEFLGDAIAVPAELPTKAGSDFDVDKLNTYINNYRINRQGYPEYVTFSNSIQETRDLHRDDFRNRVKNDIDRLVNQERKNDFREELILAIEAIQAADNAGAEDLTGFASSGTKDFIAKNEDIVYSILDQHDNDQDAINTLLNHIQKGQDLAQVLEDEYVRKMTKKAVQNRYFSSIGDIVLAPDNFKKLISPNSSKEFAQGEPDSITDNLLKLKGILKGGKQAYNPTQFLSTLYMIGNRANYLKSKGGTGISAVGSTSHANYQRFLSFLDLTKKTTQLDQRGNPRKPKVWEDPSVKFNHSTVTIQGRQVPTISTIGSDDYNILEYLSKLTNGSVDALADDWLSKYGMTAEAAGVVVLMMKMHIDPNEIGYLVNHPFVKEYMKVQALRKSDLINFNPRLKEQYDDLRKDDDYLTYFEEQLGISRYRENIPQFTPADINTLKNQIKQGGQYSDPAKLTYSNNREKELALTALRQFLQLLDLSRDLLTSIQTSNHETVYLNSNAIVPAKESNYNWDKVNSPFRAVFENNGKLHGEDGSVSASQAVRNTTFVGPLIKNLKDTHDLIHSDILLPQTNLLLKDTINYLSNDGANTLFTQNLQDTVEQFENNQISAQLYTADSPSAFSTAKPGQMFQSILPTFNRNGEAYSRIRKQIELNKNRTQDEKDRDGTLVFDYITPELIDKTNLWFLKVTGKPTNSDVYGSNVFYQALQRLQYSNPQVFSDIMLASTLQNGIDFNQNNLVNFLDPTAYSELSKSVQTQEYSPTFFDSIKDLYVQNNYTNTDDDIFSNLSGFTALPSFVENGRLVLNTQSYSVDGGMGEIPSTYASINNQVVLYPSHRYKSRLLTEEEQQEKRKAKQARGKAWEEWDKYSTEKYHKPNWGAGEDYLVIPQYNSQTKLKEYKILKKLPITLDTRTQNPKSTQMDDTTFYVYQQIPTRGIETGKGRARINEMQLPDPTNPSSYQSQFLQNQKGAKPLTAQQVYDQLNTLKQNRMISLYGKGYIKGDINYIQPTQADITEDLNEMASSQDVYDSAPEGFGQSTPEENEAYVDEKQSTISTPQGLPDIRPENTTEGSCE